MGLFSVACNTMWLDGGGMYGHVPKTLWERWTPPDVHNRVQFACRSLLLQTREGRNVLFDAGVGDFFEPKLKERYGIEGEQALLTNLAALGVGAEDVDSIILSHLHFDHAGGLLSLSEGKAQLRFPRAKYYLSKAHWERALAPTARERASFIPVLHSLLATSGRLVLLDKTTHPDLDFGLTLQFSQGHTVGLMVSHLETAEGPLVYASDLVPGMAWLHLSVTTGYDRYAELLVEEKEQLLKTLAAQKGRVLFVHDLQTACARISCDAQGKYVGEVLKGTLNLPQ